MAILASATTAADSRRAIVSNGVGAHLTSFIGANRFNPDAAPPPGPEALYPMAFLVEQPAESVVAAHFHEANQWQVVVAGGGMLGSHAVAAGAVHYSNAFSAYGPIAAGPEGVWYFTLRNGYDRGAQYLPGARATLREVKRKFREATGEGEAGTLVPEADDGLGAWRHRLAPGQRLVGPDPMGGEGQFWVVAEGALRGPSGETLPRLSLVFVAPEEPAFVAEAGESGADLVLVQYPRGRDHVAAD
jgi:hypothetical protein